MLEQSSVTVTSSPKERATSPALPDQITLLVQRGHNNVHSERSLEQTLREKVGPGLILKLTTNVSTMISCRRKGRALYVRIHQMFTTAPPDVIDALAAFVGDKNLAGNKNRFWINGLSHKGVSFTSSEKRSQCSR